IGIVGAPECCDIMKIQIKVENNKIVDAKLKTFCCNYQFQPCNR
ncbi:MAG TPA: hypothetical protein DCG23_06275, partial [Deltaproteobacteria bacterium]|nr:hypothetical protein [Deltaproteobacteria bacterium]